MYPILPGPKDYSLEDAECEKPFAIYVWESPLCPRCGQWLRPVDMRPVGQPFQATAACPSYHGLLIHNQTVWADLRPPKAQRGGDGAWCSSLTAEQLRVMAAEY
jgi:hypothetical protein